MDDPLQTPKERPMNYDDDDCETCDGEGSYSVDYATGSGEHGTRQVPCPDCGVGLGPEDGDE